MSTGTVITVTWMDGKVDVYRDVITHRVADGVLTIEAPPDPFDLGSLFPGIMESVGVRRPASRGTRHLVLANIREYTVEERPEL